jgi:hypothetical protein
MLRAIQTSALSNKVTKLFDNFVQTASPASVPALASGNRSANMELQAYMPESNVASRRRRNRRNRVVSALPSVRSSWF